MNLKVTLNLPGVNEITTASYGGFYPGTLKCFPAVWTGFDKYLTHQ